MTKTFGYLDYYGIRWRIHLSIQKDHFGFVSEGWEGSVACPLGVVSWKRSVPFAVVHQERSLAWGR